MFKKSLPLALTFYVSSSQNENEQSRTFEAAGVPTINKGETFVLTTALQPKTSQMPQIDSIKIELIGQATTKREQSIFYRKEVVLPSDIQCLEIPLQADFPVASLSRSRCFIAYSAVLTIKSKNGEATATTRFDYACRCALNYEIPQVIAVRTEEYDFVFLCENIVLEKSQTLRGKLIGEASNGVKQIRISLFSQELDAKPKELGGIELAKGLNGAISFELPLAGYDLIETVYWFGVCLQSFASLEIERLDGSREQFLMEIVVV